ncbi:BRO1 domain [Trinorchestia longiramus]|nr:BRO1 domain [Trinorchestia longiramus]
MVLDAHRCVPCASYAYVTVVGAPSCTAARTVPLCSTCYLATYLGSDPRLQTCRGKLQNTRSKLNLEINKELMLRTGAENLLNATHNKKMKEQVAMELQFFNSNLKLLKEQLAELNSSVEIYQGNNARSSIPMIPLGLKETKEIDFRQPFKNFIQEHYHEDPDQYDAAITDFMELREAMRTPERDSSGVALIFEYFNQLYFIDRRFFPPDRSLGVFFEWYDSLTGTPSCQRTVAFEKACVLFNLAALYTQLGARHDRTTASGLDSAVNCLLRSAGVFKYIHDTFTNAPSKDLSPELLTALIKLMLSQARECLHEKASLNCDDTTESLLELAQEAAHTAQEYMEVHESMVVGVVRDYVPASWITLVQIKSLYYGGRAHQHVAEALLCFTGDPTQAKEDDTGLSNRAQEILQYLHKTPEEDEPDKLFLEFTMPSNAKERTYLGLTHGREAGVQYEEALRQQRMCRELRKRTALSEVLKAGFASVAGLLEDFEDQTDLMAIFDPPPIMPSTKIQLTLATPDFTRHRVDDVFHALGPVSCFSAKKSWTAPRPVILKKTERQGLGFSVRGDAPVAIAAVDPGSLAERAGLQENDIVVAIGGADVKWMPHDRVVSAIRESGDCLEMMVVTPLLAPPPYYQLTKCKSLKDLSSHSTTSSSSGVSSSGSSTRSSKYGSINSSRINDSTLHGSINSSRINDSTLRGSINSSTLSSTHKEKRLSWNPFKKTLSKDRLKAESMNDCTLIAR